MLSFTINGHINSKSQIQNYDNFDFKNWKLIIHQ
jgi:hypothetical protein